MRDGSTLETAHYGTTSGDRWFHVGQQFRPAAVHWSRYRALSAPDLPVGVYLYRGSRDSKKEPMFDDSRDGFHRDGEPVWVVDWTGGAIKDHPPSYR